jgi:antitoxin FitA
MVAIMSTITIKDIPPAIHRTLKAQAQAHRRSLNKEILATLENALHSTRLDVDSIMLRARAVRETMDIYLTENELAAFKSEGRR